MVDDGPLYTIPLPNFPKNLYLLCVYIMREREKESIICMRLREMGGMEREKFIVDRDSLSSICHRVRPSTCPIVTAS